MSDDVKIKVVTEGAKSSIHDMNRLAASVEGLRVAASRHHGGGPLAGLAAGAGAVRDGLQKVLSVFRQFSSMAAGLAGIVVLFQHIRYSFRRTAEEAAGLGKSMLQAAREAEALDTTAAGMDAIRGAAAAAGVSAQDLDDTLAKYKRHEITFGELATAIGTTAEKLAELEQGGSPGSAFAARMARIEETRARTRDERKSLRAATEAIRHAGGGDHTPEARAAWDALLKAAGGDQRRVPAVYDRYKAWHNFTHIGVMGFGTAMGQLPAAAARYEASRQEEARKRAEARARHDAATLGKRRAAAARDAAKWHQADDQRRAEADLLAEASVSPEAAEAARKRIAEAEAAARARLAEAEAAEAAPAPPAAPAAPAAKQPASSAAAIREEIDSLVRQRDIVERAAAAAQQAADQRRKAEVDAHTADVERDQRIADTRLGKQERAREREKEIEADKQKKIDAITVEAPRAATAAGAAGMIMGRQIDNAETLRERREVARDAILKEATTLLAQIREALDE